jgi:RHS repeat-associated protein
MGVNSKEISMKIAIQGCVGGIREALQPLRAVKVQLAVAAIVLTCCGQTSGATTPTSVDANSTSSRTALAAPMGFSSAPTDVQFLHAGLFPEPLAPAGKTTRSENRDLAHAVVAYRDAVRSTGDADAVEPLLVFLDRHPDSAWKPALQLNLGIIYRKTGHFSKALETWHEGWRDSRGLVDPRGRALANAIVARLSQLEAYLGRKEVLEPLLTSIQGRSIGGTAAQLVTDSHTGMFEMVHDPEESFRCGPLALIRILESIDPKPSPTALKVLQNAHSTSNGLSLTAVQEIAVQAQMEYQMAYRSPGAPVLLPAVAHWKVGHYAAIVRQEKGRYVVQDTTFGEDIRVSPSTLDEEATGYFLVPTGPLPRGWRSVSQVEGNGVWGRGDTGSNHDGGGTGCIGGNGGSSGNSGNSGNGNNDGGCTTAGVELSVVGEQLTDAPVGYTPPVGPAVEFGMVYSHRDTQQPATFSYTNFGPKWTFTWLSYITVPSSTNSLLYRRGGGNEPFTFSSGTATTSYTGPYSEATLTRRLSGGAPTGFTLTYPDGSFAQYNLEVGSQFFMTAVGDPAGNTVTLTYDSQTRITAISDALGQVTTLSYGVSGSPLLVTQITDPFGRSSSFTYNGSGQLASITDVLGISSSYTYGQGTDPDFINTLTTPYGSTTFTYGDSSTNPNLGDTRFLTTVDPLGRTSYVEFDQLVDAGDSSDGVMINSSLIPVGMNTTNANLEYRNTFVFDANQYALATQSGGLNYSLAHVLHWLHTSDVTTTSRVMESEKQPLENRIWYNYAVEPDGSSIFFGVSSGGTVTSGATAQPVAIGRVLDNGSTQLQTYQYNANGNVTQATDPVGRQTTYTYAANGIDRLTTSNTTSGSLLLETRTYNAQHLPLTVTGANGATAHFQYNAVGGITRYTDPEGHPTSYTYDSSQRLKKITGPLPGATNSYTYDNVNRVATVTDPAGSTIHITYDAADRPTRSTYPDGTTNQFGYTLLDLTSTTDRMHQTTRVGYDADREPIEITDPAGNTIRKGYNAAGALNSLTDPNGHTTTFGLDAESRVISKLYANGTSTAIAYEDSISLVAVTTDALSQTRTYNYNSDNTVASIGYSSRLATPSVSYTYDPIFRRLSSVSDGTGATEYTYYPSSGMGANLLQAVASPIAGTSGTDTVAYMYDALDRIVGTSVNGAAQSVEFDALGRTISASNPLDTFTVNYADATPRVSSVSSNAGPASALTYFGPTGDELLQQLNYATNNGATALAQFGYTYNADNIVKTLTVSSPSAQTLSYSYDAANRLVSGVAGGGSPQYVYGYDHASNITSIAANGTTESYSFTSTNAITSGTYDANGSPTLLSGQSYKWDGENRIVQTANTATNSGSSFTYDGLGRLVRVVDTQYGAITEDHSYTWCDTVLCLAHDNTQPGSPVSTQYFPQGMITGGTLYYYALDNLGDVSQIITTAGSVAGQYSYDPYGNRTTVTGTLVSDIGYAGYFFHGASGLEFALHRAYDPVHARWLNRDPIGEAGGSNLYAFVDGNPISESDPTGNFGLPGAIAGLAIDLGKQIFLEHRSLKCVNWGEVVISGILGLVLPGLPDVGDAFFLEGSAMGWASAFAWSSGQASMAFAKHMERSPCGC